MLESSKSAKIPILSKTKQNFAFKLQIIQISMFLILLALYGSQNTIFGTNYIETIYVDYNSKNFSVVPSKYLNLKLLLKLQIAAYLLKYNKYKKYKHHKSKKSFFHPKSFELAP